MISRIWRGWTTHANAAAYQGLLETEILPGIVSRGIAGHHGTQLLRRHLEGETEFVTILWFDSLESVRAFAGEDYETAVVPAKARQLLSRFDARSAHYETLLSKQTLPAAEDANAFGFAPMIRSQSMNIGSPNPSGLVHRETIPSYCGSSSDVKLSTT